MNCLNCGNETNNPKFCSRSCNVSYQNKQNPKRSKTGSCKRCGQSINSTLSYCPNCRNGRDMTLQQAIYHRHHKSSAFALVRSRARAILRKANRTTCEQCDYDKHVEAAHKKPISEYDLNTPISVINHPDNLVALCPNCHWELDNNLLSL